ncbi:polysaccharide biosynthesis tyrosine autokinase [Saccharopolyspora mangrovi]|uniref:Polysaccharide biosynthesis tyrosine autokinase n=1 Tax=Saccharopolyspora mangrovi TaxID=3082379 RepID=A0ABU6A4R6_9PSEU|nr:polysaccharide biosynthesis tyrosine autokinase [Saccharopolyspora sp. S2-29]MEB3366468.1 polysaccharide biosynthesis tyrosine autokinase [Saccharopolyspora sp. S2-29]
MSFSRYLQIVRERWRLIVAGSLLGLLVAMAVSFGMQPRYTSHVTLFISARATDTADAYQGSLLSAQKVQSYVALLSSERLSGEVIERTQTHMKPEELSERITAVAEPDTVLITASVFDPSPQQAQHLAGAVGEQFTKLVTELERPADGSAPTVIAKIVQPATLPNEPVAPTPLRYCAFGVLLGMICGLAGAFARNALDNSIKSAAQLTSLTELPNLGTVAYASSVSSMPLVVHEDPQAPRAESFRQIRTNLQYVDIDQPASVMLVTSSVPEEGKSTTLCNLAIAAAQAGNRVAVIEADLRRPRAADYLGLEGAVGLTSVLVGRVSLEDALQPWGEMFSVLASGPVPPNPSELVASNQMKTLLNSLRDQFDLVLVDAPPLLPVTDAAALAAHCDGALLVVRYGKTSRDLVKSSMDMLAGVGARVFGTILNMAPAPNTNRYQYYGTVTQQTPRAGASRSDQPVRAGSPIPAHTSDSDRTDQEVINLISSSSTYK